MLDEGLIFEVLRSVLSRGGEYADIFVEHRKTTSLQLEDNKIEKVIEGVESGAGIRLISGKKTSFAFSNDLSRDSIIALASSLSRTSWTAGPDIILDLRRLRPQVDFVIEVSPDEIPVGKKIDLLKSADHAARSCDRRITQVTAFYRDFIQRIQVANSEGAIAEDERIHTIAAITVVAASDGTIQTAYEADGGLIGFELFKKISVDELALTASRRAVAMLTSKRAPGGRMPIVISSAAGGTMIHEAIGHGLEADLAQQGLSVYSNKIGMEVASRLVNVIDDPTLPNKRGSFRFDDEGTPAERTILVDGGMLVGFMYDRLSAMRDGAASTGNGRRESYRHRPIPRMTNTFIAPGESSPDEVLRSTPNGFFVRKMGGGQVNTVTGDFVFDVQEGFLIENGLIGDPVRGATLIGNGPEVLRSIDMVASDLGFSIGTCGKDSQGVPISDAMPTIRIPEMVVGGEVKV
jgi:TldD protein